MVMSLTFNLIPVPLISNSLFTATYLFILCCRHPPEMVVRELLRAVASADHHRRDGRTRTGRPCAPVASAVVCRGHELQKKGVQRSGAQTATDTLSVACGCAGASGVVL